MSCQSVNKQTNTQKNAQAFSFVAIQCVLLIPLLPVFLIQTRLHCKGFAFAKGNAAALSVPITGFWEKKLQNLEMAGVSGQPHLLSGWNEKQRFV